MLSSSRLQAWLTRAHPALFIGYAMAAAFSTYFSMYAFRKPFTAGTFEGVDALVFPVVGAVAYKTIIIITQVLGYCTSKFLGIKIISEMTPQKRSLAILACTALVCFVVCRPSTKVSISSCIFLIESTLFVILSFKFAVSQPTCCLCYASRCPPLPCFPGPRPAHHHTRTPHAAYCGKIYKK